MKSDELYMSRALTLASRAAGRTSPNPVVGAVIVQRGRIISEGYHRKAGLPHAEAVALKKAGSSAAGSTLYVSLEPCSHRDKKTPPCTDAIIAAGVSRVVAAVTDPNPKVAGRGLRALRRAGIATTVGVMRNEARRLNESFTKFITQRQPFVLLKIAQSLDGKIATARGESKWITGAQARAQVHRLRNELDAVLVGVETVVRDNPSLDCRTAKGRNPFRIIVDSRLRIPLKSKVLHYRDSRTIIACTQRASAAAVRAMEGKGATILQVTEKAGKVDLKALMKELGKLDIMSLMIEGGSSISASALASGIVDKVMFFIAPKLIGGSDSISSVGGVSPRHLASALQLTRMQSRAFGDDILIEGYL